MNPLMNAMGKQTPNSSSNISALIQMLKSGNPTQIAQTMMQNNPQFRQFVQQHKGKTPDQVARELGIDLSGIMNRM